MRRLTPMSVGCVLNRAKVQSRFEGGQDKNLPVKTSDAATTAAGTTVAGTTATTAAVTTDAETAAFHFVPWLRSRDAIVANMNPWSPKKGAIKAAKTGGYAFVNNQLVPIQVSAGQVDKLIGNCVGLANRQTGKPLFPATDGSFKFTAGEQYWIAEYLKWGWMGEWVGVAGGVVGGLGALYTRAEQNRTKKKENKQKQQQNDEPTVITKRIVAKDEQFGRLYPLEFDRDYEYRNEKTPIRDGIEATIPDDNLVAVLGPKGVGKTATIPVSTVNPFQRTTVLSTTTTCASDKKPKLASLALM